MTRWRVLAPAKVNLGLFIGPTRPSDGRHELVSVMQSISLADELTLAPAPAARSEADEIRCPGVEGDNLAAAALSAFRAATGWNDGPYLITIDKRIPVAAGLAGGSADAAATLRLVAAASGLGDEALLLSLAEKLGADVPAQLSPGRWLAQGVGERLERLPDPVEPLELSIVPAATGLSTAAVFAEADRLGAQRSAAELERLASRLRDALAKGEAIPDGLLHNDLQSAAISLCPAIEETLAAVRATGAQHALVSGSGPTVFAVSARLDAAGIEAAPVDASFARPIGPIAESVS